MPARDPPIAFEAKGEWYDGEIRRFVRLDNENPPARGGVVFVGSSIFREWREVRDFAADLAPLPVVNRAFGGSTARDQLRDDIMEAIVFPHEPRVLVYYCGSNDLNEGESPRRIRDAFISWSEKARARLDGRRNENENVVSSSRVTIVFVSINRAPQKKPLWDALDETNRLIKEYCETHDDQSVVFADVNPLLFEDGDAMTVPNVSLFRDDGLHFDPDPNARAYEAWVPTVRDAVFRAWDRAIEWEKRAEPGRRDAAGEGEGDAGEDPYLPPRARR
jgi:lysophospholipase L1-like esterase